MKITDKALRIFLKSACVLVSGVHSSDSNAATSSAWSGNSRRISLEYLEYPSWDSKTLLSVRKDTALSSRSEAWRYSPTAHLSFSKLLPHFLSKHVRTHLACWTCWVLKLLWKDTSMYVAMTDADSAEVWSSSGFPSSSASFYTRISVLSANQKPRRVWTIVCWWADGGMFCSLPSASKVTHIHLHERGDAGRSRFPQDHQLHTHNYWK